MKKLSTRIEALENGNKQPTPPVMAIAIEHPDGSATVDGMTYTSRIEAE